MTDGNGFTDKLPPHKDPRLPAAAILIGRTGATEFGLRYCDEEQPTVWIAYGKWHDLWECAAGMDALVATFRLCDQVIDGGKCTHCGRPTGFISDYDARPPFQLVCWYAYDRKKKEFIRGCGA